MAGIVRRPDHGHHDVVRAADTEELPAEIAEWEIQLVVRRLRAMVAASTRREIEGGNDAAE